MYSISLIVASSTWPLLDVLSAMDIVIGVCWVLGLLIFMVRVLLGDEEAGFVLSLRTRVYGGG